MTSRTRAELYLFLITFIWGSTFITTKGLLEGMSPLLYVGVRFSLAGVLFTLLFWRHLSGWTRGAVIKGTILGLLLYAGFVLQTIGLQFTTASKSAFITGMLVVFTPLCQVLLERRAPKTGNILGVILVAVGLYFLTSPEGSSLNIGDGMTLGCALMFAFYIVFIDMFSREHSPAHLTLMQFVTCAVLGLGFSPVFEVAMWTFEERFILPLLYLAVFATVIALYVQTRYQRDSTPTRSAVIFATEPVIAAGFAYVVAGETLGTLGMVGGGVIIAGLLISELSDVIFKNVPEVDEVSPPGV